MADRSKKHLPYRHSKVMTAPAATATRSMAGKSLIKALAKLQSLIQEQPVLLNEVVVSITNLPDGLANMRCQSFLSVMNSSTTPT